MICEKIACSAASVSDTTSSNGGADENLNVDRGKEEEARLACVTRVFCGNGRNAKLRRIRNNVGARTTKNLDNTTYLIVLSF